jgi:hypothetical protein
MPADTQGTGQPPRDLGQTLGRDLEKKWAGCSMQTEDSGKRQGQWLTGILGSWRRIRFFFFFLAVLGLELRAYTSSHSTSPFL